MTAYGIALDIGTSGTRAHAVDLSNGKILSTTVTDCHPLPGANVMDHLTFCINVGNDIAHRILMDTVNKVIRNLGIDLKKVERVSICGNPIQLSLFQGIPVDDLAFAGDNAKREKGIVEQARNAGVFSAVDVGMEVPDGTELLVPPAIRHEIGADALAMMYKSGFLEDKRNCMVTDYGTNAEMALKVGDDIAAFPTEGFTGGTKYTELKMLGVSTRKFDYRLTMKVNLNPGYVSAMSDSDYSQECDLSIRTEVENMAYELSSSTNSIMYFYDVYLGPEDMLKQPFGAYRAE